ncbi:MAG: hypothetical protein HOC20_13105 [Chloroflexi bacterium]|jgi:adenylate kinase|nr:hypothetical protein [Chloroflexota bacterium]
MSRFRGVLLIGVTGSGKTPLGNTCVQEGLWGRRCCHFDFGANLRRVAATGGGNGSLLTDKDISIVANSLRTGALLENDNFHIAQGILMGFAEEKKLGNDDLLLLNGMPRHIGQAEDVDVLVDVGTVVHLNCTPEVVYERIRMNSGGDRSERLDDSFEEIEKKVKLFEERTFPLLNHYQGKCVKMREYNVLAGTTAENIHDWLSSSG